MATAAAAPTKSLRDPELIARLQQLRKVDNLRNLAAVARTWLFLGLTIAAAVGFDQWRMASDLHWAWNVPVFTLAIVCIGAGQHQLTALGHEASHYVLLNHRLWNEIVSDWFCMHPLLTTTHHYRLQHMAHHQFVNDPKMDPNFEQFQVNGHWKRFPMARPEFWRQFAASLLPWNVVRFIRATAAYNSVPSDTNPYQKANGPMAKTARRVGVAYFVVLSATMIGLVLLGRPDALLIGAGALWLAAMIFYTVIPDDWYFHSRLHPPISMRWVTLARLTVMTVMLAGVAWLTLLHGRRVFTYFALLWLVPLATSFSFFMMMRQIVQHANADRGWLTNTRIMLVNRWIRGSILPYGQDYHLPHHMYATVPHYNLKQLHDTLMEYPEYRQSALVVHGAIIPKPGCEYPTLVEMFGAAYAPAARTAAFIDNTVLDDVDVDEKDEILKAGEQSRLRPSV